LQNRSGNGHGRRDVDVVVRYAGDLEGRDDSGDQTIVRVVLSASTGKGMKICWKQADLRDASASCFSAVVVDDGFVQLQPALDGVGWLSEKLVKGLRDEIVVGGKDFVLERVDSSKILVSLFSELILLGCGVMAMSLFIALGPEAEAVED
jgi:hypothetical protein